MSDAWKDREKAQEDSYFQKRDKEALAKLKADSNRVRKSPITGEPMETIVIDGVTVDRCRSSRGIWLDAGELEQILRNQETALAQKKTSWLGDFLSGLVKH